MSSKIFWALLILAIYLGIMLSEKDSLVKYGVEKVYEYISTLIEGLEIRT